MAPALPSSPVSPGTEDGPWGVHRGSLTLPPHWGMVSLWQDTQRAPCRPFPAPCASPACSGQWLQGRRTGTALPGAAQVNSPLWTSLHQHRLFRGHGRDRLNAWGASGWPSLPALLYFCFIIQPSLLLGSWSEIKAAGIQLDRTKNTPSPHMCATGISVAVGSCLDQRANLQLGFADVQYFANLSQLKGWWKTCQTVEKQQRFNNIIWNQKQTHKTQINLIKILSVGWLSLYCTLKVNQIPPDDSCRSSEETAIKDNWLKSLNTECAQTLLQSSKMWVG